MADQILTNGSNIARKNKITLKVDGVELGVGTAPGIEPGTVEPEEEEVVEGEDLRVVAGLPNKFAFIEFMLL